MANKLLINLKSQSIYFLPSSPFLFSKHSNICFAISFCILAFPLGGFIRNMNILLGHILLIFILYSISSLATFVMRVMVPVIPSIFGDQRVNVQLSDWKKRITRSLLTRKQSVKFNKTSKLQKSVAIFFSSKIGLNIKFLSRIISLSDSCVPNLTIFYFILLFLAKMLVASLFKYYLQR